MEIMNKSLINISSHLMDNFKAVGLLRVGLAIIRKRTLLRSALLHELIERENWSEIRA
jgi:hypothetical protein